jgi:hypothetical protein
MISICTFPKQSLKDPFSLTDPGLKEWLPSKGLVLGGIVFGIWRRGRGSTMGSSVHLVQVVSDGGNSLTSYPFSEIFYCFSRFHEIF